MKCVRVVGRKSTIGTWCGSQTQAGTNTASLVASAASNSPIPATPGTRNSTARLTTIGESRPIDPVDLPAQFPPMLISGRLHFWDARRAFFIARRPRRSLYILRFYSRTIWAPGGGEADPIKPLHHSWCFVRNPRGFDCVPLRLRVRVRRIIFSAFEFLTRNGNAEPGPGLLHSVLAEPKKHILPFRESQLMELQK